MLAVFEKWGLDCAEVGIVTADDVMRVYHGGVLEAEIPNKALTDDAPVYKRPVGEWVAPVPKESSGVGARRTKEAARLHRRSEEAAGEARISAGKHYIYEQYDSMVQTNTVQGPGGEAGVMRIKGSGIRDQGSAHAGVLEALTHLLAESTPEGEAALLCDSKEKPRSPERGLAMALAGNGRWCYLDPKLGAMHAVAEAARKVACTGATPVAATNCLNFGNPEKPEIMAQLSAAIDGHRRGLYGAGNSSYWRECKSL